MQVKSLRDALPPCVLCLSGHDPTGGAGLRADAEAVAAQGAHALTVITADTVQDTRNVSRVLPVAPQILAAQADAVIADCRIGAIKIGLLGDPAQVPFVAALIDRLRVPAVLDPVLRAGGGRDLASRELEAALLAELLPRVDVLTPNAAEARRLTQLDTVDAAGPALLRLGAANVLVTGGDESGPEIVDLWFRRDAAPRRYVHARLEGGFHGAGCTLASALAARLALGDALEDAVEAAERYTQESLRRARAIGLGRPLPGRLP